MGEGGIVGTMGVFMAVSNLVALELAEGTKPLLFNSRNQTPHHHPQVPVSNDPSGNNGRDYWMIDFSEIPYFGGKRT